MRIFSCPLLCLALSACAPQPSRSAAAPAPPAPTDAAEADPSGSVWDTCYRAFSPTGNPRSDLERLTRACGPLGGMRAITPIQMGKQSDRDPVERYTFYVPAAGKCYRVYATSTTRVQDLDLLLRDPEGNELAADVTHDSWPVLPPREPLCVERSGLYILEVSVFRGEGHYALQVWGH